MLKKSLSLLLALVMLLAIIPTVTLAAGDTADYDGHRYQRFDKGMTWTEAKAYCENLGGYLATVDSQSEQSVLEKLIEGGTQSQYWLGASDEGGWHWITGEPLEYTNWAQAEPNKYTTNGPQAMYLQMYRLPNPVRPWVDLPGQWQDNPNDNTLANEEDFFSIAHVGFICEWDMAATPPAPTPSAAFTAMAIDTGVKFDWTEISGSLGYRVYRSTTPGVEGISITDFMITSTSFVDVNVDTNTTYYYTLRSVLKEASVSGDREQLGNPSAQISVTTGATILGGNVSDMGNATKNIILMKLNDPYMSVNGQKQEIDPGRGTTPQSLNGRTMVPIRAIIEAMGGTVVWEEATQQITLNAGGHTVVMWLNQKDITVDGQAKQMDVVPQSINGRTMVPVRFAAENVGCVVDWIASTSEIVVVYYTGGAPAIAETPSTPPVIEPPVTGPTARPSE